jgi:AraC family transcriptional regulator
MHMTRPLARLALDCYTLELWPKNAYEVQHINGYDTIGFAFETQSGVDAICSEQKRVFHRQANTLSWIPRDCPVFSWSMEGGEYLVIQGGSAKLVEHHDAAQRPLNAIVDAAAVQAAYRLRRLLMCGTMTAPVTGAGVMMPTATDTVLHIDADWGQPCISALAVLSAALFDHFDGPRLTQPWMTGSRMAAVDQFIDQHMHESMTIDRLAAALSLSVGFLIRAFRQSLSMTPHRYIMERRLAHARRSLSAKASIATVAFACGFTDQAHLTRIMQQTIGVTPSRYRRKYGN